MKKILAVTVLVMILLGTVFTNASGETITINGVKYMLSDVESFTDIPMIEKQAQNLYKALSGFPKVKSYVYLVNSSRTVDLKKDVTAVPAFIRPFRNTFQRAPRNTCIWIPWSSTPTTITRRTITGTIAAQIWAITRS